MTKPKLIFLGTVHAGYTDNEELIKIIKKYDPAVILVEIKQEDIDSGHVNKYPPEMTAVHTWAQSNGVSVKGIDHDTNELIPGKEKHAEHLVNRQLKVLETHNWKEFNNQEMLDLLLVPEWSEVIDASETKKREEKMASIIISQAAATGVTVVVTGSGHIPFYKNKFPNAAFPLTSVSDK